MTEGGDIDKLGRGTIWEGQIPTASTRTTFFASERTGLLEPSFLRSSSSPISRSDISIVSQNARRIWHRQNKTQVRAFRFPVPPSAREQSEIIAIMTASKANARRADAQGRRRSATLKKSLMHDLLTGRVRVTRLGGGRRVMSEAGYVELPILTGSAASPSREHRPAVSAGPTATKRRWRRSTARWRTRWSRSCSSRRSCGSIPR